MSWMRSNFNFCLIYFYIWHSKKVFQEKGGRPFTLNLDDSFLQNCAHFVDDYFNADQQPAVVPLSDHLALHPVEGEAGEQERAAGPHVEAGVVERLDDAAAEGLANI